jgi:regulator of protease activity HflC (stomatin/prohibitin superfamily)
MLLLIEIIVGLAVFALMGGLIYYFLLRIEVHEQQKVVIERLGKYHRVLEPGWRIKWPLIERKKRFKEEGDRMTDYIDLRERTADLAKQQVITKDKIELTVDSVVYYQISDAYKAVYAQKDVLGAIHQKIKTELRNVIGNIDLEQLIRGQQEINDQLQAKLQASANDWGLTLRSIELQSITPPESYKRVSEAELEVQKARLEVQQAELAKQAAIERAQGLKHSTHPVLGRFRQQAQAHGHARLVD